LKLVYIPGSDPAYFRGLDDLTGCCALVHTVDYAMYKALVEHKASAFMAISGKWYGTDHSEDLVPRMLREKMLLIGKIPGFAVRCKDAQEAVLKEATTVHLTLKQTERKATSRDVLAVIEGTDPTLKNESIVITGHYDSVLVGTGSWDNATGAAMLNQLYNHFIENKPKRTLRFVWCGSEEQGLYGSINYIKQHMDLMKEIQFCFNFDMNGTILGTNSAFITGDQDLKTYYEQTCKEYGYISSVRMGIHSSDSAPFALQGIPSLGLSRGSMGPFGGNYEIHTRHDLMPTLSAKEMFKNSEFAKFIIGRVAKAVQLPVARKLPEDMKKQADAYFWLDKLPEYKVFE
ncbi:MAG: M28 family peptidase, partial [Erysipelotrichaceae bacterium]|nr:M28 family peptidase [Erysipelotrichaceae bacterium]